MYLPQLMLQYLEMSNVQTTPVIGLPLNVGWSQVVSNSRGSLVCSFSVAGENANNIGRDIAEELIESDPKNSSELHNKLLDVLAKVRRSNNQLQIACILFTDGVITLATHHGSILLRRGNKIGRILVSGNEPKIIEGHYKTDDLYVLGTHQATPYQEEIKIKLSQGFDIDTVITSIVPELHAQNDSSLSAFAFVEVKPAKIPRVVQVEPIENIAQEIEPSPVLNKRSLASEESHSQAVNEKKTQAPFAAEKTSTEYRATTQSFAESAVQTEDVAEPKLNAETQPSAEANPATKTETNEKIELTTEIAVGTSEITAEVTAQTTEITENAETAIDDQAREQQSFPLNQSAIYPGSILLNQELINQVEHLAEAETTSAQNGTIPTGTMQPAITTQQFGLNLSKKKPNLKLPKLPTFPKEKLGQLLAKFRQIRFGRIGLIFKNLVKIIWTKVVVIFQVLLTLVKYLIAKIRRQPNQIAFRDKNYLRNQLRNLIIALVVIALFVITVIWYQWQKNTDIAAINKELAPYNQRLDEVKKLSESNVLEARKQTTEIMNGLRSLAEKNQNNKRRFELVKVRLLETQEFADKIAGLEQMSQLPVFFDLRLVQTGFIVGKAEIYEQTGFFLDAEKKQIVKLDLEKKQAKLITLPDATPKPKDMVYGEQSIFLLGEGLRKIANKGEGNITTLKEEGDSDKDGSILTNFGKYLYVFNPEKRNIYRYLINDNAVSEPIGWLVDKQGLDFGQISSMTIDGDLWLTSKSGEIKKYSKGSKADFSISGMENPFKANILLFTKDSLTNLYVIEPDQKRLVILNKQGQFLREIKSESFASATTLVVSETMKKALVVSGSIIFEVEI